VYTCCDFFCIVCV